MTYYTSAQTALPEELKARRSELLKEIGQLARERDALQRALGAIEERFQVARAELFMLRTGDGDE